MKKLIVCYKIIEPRKMARNTEPRVMVGEHQQHEFASPFYHAEYAEEGIIPQIETIPRGDFPNNIQRWIWSDPGQNDERSWEAIFQLQNDNGGERYCYFTAWCDYTGFDCQGGLECYVARDIPTLIQYAMRNEAYERYLETTQPVQN